VKRAIADGLVKREDLFITTKAWVQDMHKAGDTYASVKRSLALSGLDYFDLVLLHQAMGDYFTAYRDLEKAAKDGLTKAIGVSNYFPSILVNLCENVEIIPAVNQIEAHSFFTREEDLRVMKSYGIVPQAWSPLAEGNYGIFTDPDLTAIGKKYGKTAAQVALRWNVQRGFSIIPKSTHEERIKENLDIWDFALTEDEMKTISAKDKGKSSIINHFDPDLVKNLNHLSFEH
jgi:diketogulonate reductase-like aldo/keto reductase